jgi:hypothetical protein
MSRIRVSPKHGVNPSLSICFYCHKDKNEIALPGRLPQDAKAPHRAVWNMEPCDECKDWMSKGVICISARPGNDTKDPYRTGGWAVVRDEAITRMFDPESAAAAIKARVCFVEDEAWDKLGLPRITEVK